MKRRTIEIILGLGIAALLIAATVIHYMINMPQRNVQGAKTDFSLSASQIVGEYMADAAMANNKYLQEEGNSKILSITGKIHAINEDMNNQKVILLKDPSQKAGVSCTFTKKTNASTEGLQIGQIITVKGVIRSGAGFDKDLDLYEDVIMEKCDVTRI